MVELPSPVTSFVTFSRGFALCLLYWLLTSNARALVLFGLFVPEALSIPRGLAPDVWKVILDLVNRISLLAALSLCGPLRVLAVTTALTPQVVGQFTLQKHVNVTMRRKGTILVILVFILFACFDYDEHDDFKALSVRHAVHHLLHHWGMSDHKVGLACLIVYILTLPLNIDQKANWAGSTTLLALSLLYAIWTVRSPSALSAAQAFLGFFCGLVFFWTGPIYKIVRLRSTVKVHQYCSLIVLGLLVQQLLFNPRKHPLSLGAGLAMVVLALAVHLLTAESSVGYRALLGFSDRGLPLYTDKCGVERDAHDLMDDIKHATKAAVDEILKHSDSRKIFYFLCLNLSFTFVEMSYGLWTNSLGLLSDGFHMLFDCTALIFGLYASLVSKKPPDKLFTYGYGRAEVLAGYVNGLFLLIVGIFVLVEAFSRLFHPPEIKSERLLVVSVLGLIINLVGVFSFGHLHAHHGCDHDHGGKHCDRGEHGKDSHDYRVEMRHHLHGGHYHEGHSDLLNHRHEHRLEYHREQPRYLHHNEHVYQPGKYDARVEVGHGPRAQAQKWPPGHDDFMDSTAVRFDDKLSDRELSVTDNANMRGVFLHILADTLGSVGVIISSFLIRAFGWNIADPICSLFIAGMIMASVIPMLWEAAEVLCLRIPRSMEKPFFACINKISHLPGVVGCKDYHLWVLSSHEMIGSIHVLVSGDRAGQFDRQQVDDIVSAHVPTAKIYIHVDQIEECPKYARYPLRQHIYY